MSILSGSETLRKTSSAFIQFSPRQSPQVVIHFSLFLWHEEILLPHGFLDDNLHLHHTNFKWLSGATFYQS